MIDIFYRSGFENHLRLYTAGNEVYVSISDNEDYGTIDRKFTTKVEAIECYRNTKSIFEECANKLRAIGWEIESEEYDHDSY